MPADAVAAKEEAQAAAVKDFAERAAKIREFLDQKLGKDVRTTLNVLAQERPADAKALMGQVFSGKISPGEVASAPKATDKDVLKLAPREYLNTQVASHLIPAICNVYSAGSRRAVSDLGAAIMQESSFSHL